MVFKGIGFPKIDPIRYRGCSTRMHSSCSRLGWDANGVGARRCRCCRYRWSGGSSSSIQDPEQLQVQIQRECQQQQLREWDEYVQISIQREWDEYVDC